MTIAVEIVSGSCKVHAPKSRDEWGERMSWWVDGWMELMRFFFLVFLLSPTRSFAFFSLDLLNDLGARNMLLYDPCECHRVIPTRLRILEPRRCLLLAGVFASLCKSFREGESNGGFFCFCLHRVHIRTGWWKGRFREWSEWLSILPLIGTNLAPTSLAGHDMNERMFHWCRCRCRLRHMAMTLLQIKPML